MDSPPPYQEHSPCAKSNKHHESQEANIGSPVTLSSEGRASILNTNHNDRKAFLCSQLSMSFDEAKEIFSNVPLSKSTYPRGRFHSCNGKVCNTNGERFQKYRKEDGNISHELISTVTLFWAPSNPIVQATNKGIFTLDRLLTGLYGLDLPICPHLRLNQDFVLRRFNPGCLMTKNPKTGSCTCPDLADHLSGIPTTPRPKLCKNVGRCPVCWDQGVTIGYVLFWRESMFKYRQKQVALTVGLIRDFGSLENADDPAWLASSMKSCELEYMVDIWQDYEKYALRLCSQWFESLCIPSEPMISSAMDPLADKVAPPPKTNREPRTSVEKKSSALKRITENLFSALQRLRNSLSSEETDWDLESASSTAPKPS
ncbi:hypothetical protein GJ744_011482 [Endocarpon pusillum]|uniref:Uncharacterized protein n=1 Tax=Endocarpon pusillum TaxID=364733 RepID=A0A8H7E3H5_9EURO|nr:hypothetical protein GJ744_011482 [Endocarpon pusillum]